MPRQMCREIEPASKDQTSRINAALLCLTPQIAFGRSVVAQQPQHASRHAVQNPHPNLKYRLRDLVAVVEAAEHKTLLRQASGASCARFRAGLGHWPLAVVNLIR